MFLLTSLLVLFWFSYKDHKTGLVETKQVWPMYLIALGFVLLFGNILQSVVVAFAFFLIMLALQISNITYRGDTIVIPLIALLYPGPFVLLVALTTGFVFASFSKQERISFLPLFFIGFLFALTTNLFVGF